MSADVVVIGGGFAGLSAATALAERGARVTVLEARPSLGGRASAFTDPATGERVDNGQHVLFGCYHETFRFLRRIGTDSSVPLQQGLAIRIVDRAGRASRLACPPWPAPLHLVAGVLRWSALGWRDRLAILAMRHVVARRSAVAEGARATTARSHETPDETVHTWLRKHGQTPRLIEVLWEPLAVAALNQPIDVASAGPFVRVLQLMFSADPRDSALGLPKVPLDDLYAAPAQRFIESHAGTVRTSAPAEVVVRARTVSVRVRGDELRADAVVCAVPWYAIPDVFPSPPREMVDLIASARCTDASPIVTVNLWFDRALTTEAFVGLPGRVMQWVFDKRALFGEGSSHLSAVSSGANAIVAKGNQELIDLALAEIRAALPDARAAAVRRAVVVREKRATFSLAPGQPKRPVTRTPISGLFLAGDWIETGLPATIESAVVSGHWAADMAADYLGIESELARVARRVGPAGHT